MAGAAGAALLITTLVLSAPAEATAALHCTARMSVPKPKQYSRTAVYVHTSASARVTTTAHYKTTNTSHAATANRSGNATLVYAISRATKGRKIPVTVRVTKARATGSCATSFTPR